MRQSAEWGMRSFQASFPRIKDRILYEEMGERKLILEMLVYLFNFRANHVGISQIKNTYLTPLLLEGNNLFKKLTINPDCIYDFQSSLLSFS